MSASQIVLLIVVLVVLALSVGAVLAVVSRRRRTEQLRGTFGSEYDRTVESSDKKRDAERELAQRQERHAQLDVRPLPEASRQRYLTAWDGVQNRFVDSPVLALSEADALLTRLLEERGFPTDGVRTQEDMLSVEHAHVLEQFRAGHRIEQQNSTGHADTEQVRQGMLHFRSVFEELVSEGATAGDATPYPQDHQQDVREQDVRRERDVPR